MSAERPKFTEEQRAAIEYAGDNLLLAAAAGSGKTATLTERIARLILEDGADIERMLVITFTKAAAGELKARIKKRLRDEYNENIYIDVSRKRLIKKQLEKVQYAKICTIDSFLYSEIRRCLPLIGRSSDTRIIAEDDIREMRQEVMAEVIQKKFTENSIENRKNWIRFCDVISQTRATNRIDEELLLINEKIERAGIKLDGRNYIQTTTENIQKNIVSELQKEIFQILDHDVSECIKLQRKIIEEGGETIKYLKNIEEDHAVIDNARFRIGDGKTDLDKIRDALEEISFGRLAIIKAEKKTELCEECKFIRDEIKDGINAVKKDICRYSEKIFEGQNALSDEIRDTLFDALKEYGEMLDERKSSGNVMTYQDLENYAHELICVRGDLGVAERVGANYDYIFVDEYQDTNQLQDDIISAISTKSRRFMVGDVKQAIYRFRGGDPDVFNTYRQNWTTVENTASDGKALFLRRNFRCSKCIIVFTNMVTNCLFPYSDVSFTKDDLLIHGRIGDDNAERVSLNLIDVASAENLGIDGEEAEAEFAARDIAGRIGKYDPALGRVVNEEDVAIIMRSPGARSEKYRKKLVEKGINAKTNNAGAIFDYPVVRLVISVIRAIDNPLIDEYFAGVLYSSIFSFSIGSIEEIKKYAGEMPLYFGLKKIIEENDGSELALRCAEAEKWLNKYRSYSAILPVHKLIEIVLREEEIGLTPEAEHAGSEEALKAVRTIAKTYEKEFGGAKYGNDLGEFADYFDNKAKQKIESNSAENNKAVSIISIHASKGLEFPIVYLVETDRKRNRIDETSTFLVDSELGIGTYLPHESGVTVADTLQRRMIAKRISRMNMFEEMRLLYVAMTRARDRLIITGRTKDPEKTLSEARIRAKYLDDVQITNNDDYLSWILMACYACESEEAYGINVIKGEYFEENGIFSAVKESFDKECADADIEKISEENEYIYEYGDIAFIPAKLPAARLEIGYIDKIREGHTDNPETNNDGNLKYDETTYINSVTETVQNDEAEESGTSLGILPKFMSGMNEYDAAGRGTAFHSFMQFMDLENLRENGAEAELKRLVEKKFISDKLAKEIKIKDIDKFLHSSLFKMMRETNYLKREMRFNCSLDAERFALEPELKKKLAENGTKITVQGVVDCILRLPAGKNEPERTDESGQPKNSSSKGGDEREELVIIDYKTDSIPRELIQNKQKIREWCRERHGRQLEIYRELCERIFEEKIEKKFIYLTRLGRLIGI